MLAGGMTARQQWSPTRQRTRCRHGHQLRRTRNAAANGRAFCECRRGLHDDGQRQPVRARRACDPARRRRRCGGQSHHRTPRRSSARCSACRSVPSVGPRPGSAAAGAARRRGADDICDLHADPMLVVVRDGARRVYGRAHLRGGSSRRARDVTGRCAPGHSDPCLTVGPGMSHCATWVLRRSPENLPFNNRYCVNCHLQARCLLPVHGERSFVYPSTVSRSHFEAPNTTAARGRAQLSRSFLRAARWVARPRRSSRRASC
jgi:hypothetical protein